MTTDENTHVIVEVSLDTGDIKVSFEGYNAWVDAKKMAKEIGQYGFFHKPENMERYINFYPTHRINLVTISSED